MRTMRTRIVWLTAILVVFMGFGLSRGQEVENLLTNPGLEDGTASGWGGYGDNTRVVVQDLVGAAIPASPIEGDYCLHVTVGEDYVDFWNAGLTLWGGNVFESGKQYTFSFWAKSKEGEREINLKPEQNGTWTAYGEKRITITEEWAEYFTTSPAMTADVPNMQISVHVGFGPGEFWLDAARLYVGEYVETVFGPRVKATAPNPADGSTNVPQDVILSWESGPFAAVHDVYFGESFDDINDAPTMNTLDKLVSNDQPGTTYDPDDLLEFGKTYYWRIDEVNAPPDSTVFKGAVWSFTVEDFAYPITNVTATASSENTLDMGAGKTVDSSGLNGDLHSVEPTDMWLSNITGAQPTWIQFEFDKVYGLYEMWVWNSNQLLEPAIGFGVQDVTVEHSEDGENWTSLGDIQIPRAPGVPNNAHDARIDLSGATAKFVRLTVASNWGGIVQQFGLSEIRFFFIPVAASDPAPADRDSGVPLDTMLSWRSGREVVTHDVYFSNDKAAVEDGTALVDTVSEGNFHPGTLEYGQKYYWKVDEVNNAAAVPVREGEVWEFSSVENFIVEDFESYSAENPIWETWIDGLGFGAAGTPGFNPGNGTGSAVGDDTQPSFTEETIVNSGGQSMPLFYNNNKAGSANYSETERTFDQAQNWTTGGVSQVSLWFRGHAASVGSFVERPAGTFTMTGSGTDIWGTADEFHFAYKTLTGQGSIVARVESVDNTDPWAKAGVMIRETLEPGSAHAFACVTPESGVASQGRIDTGGTSFDTDEGGITAPHWVKLERSIAGVFTVSHSANGSSWVPVSGSNPTNIQMGSTVYVGLAVTSNDAGATCQAVFSNVTTTGTVGPLWTNQDIGIATNAAEPLYIGVADSAGNRATIEHEDPAAAQADSFTLWPVDLAGFADQGVNVASVKKLILGLGNPVAPVAGGAGTMYFDDIAVGNPVVRKAPVNLLTNGGFEDGGTAPWRTNGFLFEVVSQLTDATVPEDPVEGDFCMHVVIPDAGPDSYSQNMVSPGLVFEAGKIYTLSVFLKSKQGPLDIRLKPERDADPWEGYGDQVFTITDQWAEYSVTTPVIPADVDPAATTLHIGFANGDFWVDGVRFYEGEPYSPSPSGAVIVGDFEGGLDGWWAGDGFTLSNSPTGATLGTQAMQVDGPGDWHIDALLDLKLHRAALASSGATITADITAFDADMTTTWMNVIMVINGQNNDDSGANNNVGWQELGTQDVVRDGQPHTFTWEIPEALSAVLAGVDDNISWYELVLATNLDGASVTKFYIDNIQLVIPAP
jgi:hypothetical protein